MNQPREVIYKALFDLLKEVTWTFNAVPGFFRYKSRYLTSWDNLQIGQQPAIFLRELREQTRQDVLALPKWKLRAQVWIFAEAAGNMDQAQNYPAQQINPILDAIELALVGTVPGEKQTLDGLVEHCWIEGDIVINDPTAPDQQIIILIPVSISTGLGGY
jgi:hypothetical protein